MQKGPSKEQVPVTESPLNGETRDSLLSQRFKAAGKLARLREESKKRKRRDDSDGNTRSRSLNETIKNFGRMLERSDEPECSPPPEYKLKAKLVKQDDGGRIVSPYDPTTGFSASPSPKLKAEDYTANRRSSNITPTLNVIEVLKVRGSSKSNTLKQPKTDRGGTTEELKARPHRSVSKSQEPIRKVPNQTDLQGSRSKIVQAVSKNRKSSRDGVGDLAETKDSKATPRNKKYHSGGYSSRETPVHPQAYTPLSTRLTDPLMSSSPPIPTPIVHSSAIGSPPIPSQPNPIIQCSAQLHFTPVIFGVSASNPNPLSGLKQKPPAAVVDSIRSDFQLPASTPSSQNFKVYGRT